jgi:hypothetical protein
MQSRDESVLVWAVLGRHGLRLRQRSEWPTPPRHQSCAMKFRCRILESSPRIKELPPKVVREPLFLLLRRSLHRMRPARLGRVAFRLRYALLE